MPRTTATPTWFLRALVIVFLLNQFVIGSNPFYAQVPRWDYLVLSLQWGPSVVQPLGSKVAQTKLYDYLERRNDGYFFTIHGLWLYLDHHSLKNCDKFHRYTEYLDDDTFNTFNRLESITHIYKYLATFTEFSPRGF